MKERIDNLIKSLETWISRDNSFVNSYEMDNDSLDTMIEKDLSWCLHHLCPFLFIALAIDLTITFTMPRHIALSGLFWLKDPLSLGIAWLISRKLLRIL